MRTVAALGSGRRRHGSWLAVLACCALVLAQFSALVAHADNEKRVLIDSVQWDAGTQQLTFHIDVLDAKGQPEEALKVDDLEITASGKPLQVTAASLETSEKAQEPVAIVVLMNASRSYQLQAGEEVSTYKQERDGVAQFIQRLKGNDKIAVLQYREGVPHEIVYSLASGFAQAKEAVQNATVPQDDVGQATIENAAPKLEKDLAPETLRAVDKALNYLVENEDKLGAANRRFLIVMSDGKDRLTDSNKLTNKVKSILDKYEDKGIRIYAVGFTADDPKYLPILQSLANGTGGVYQKVDTKDVALIPAVWDNLANRIKKQYVLRAKVAALPDWGDPVKGKEEARYKLGVSVQMKDGAKEDASYADDIRLPLPGIDWKQIARWAAMGVGGLLGTGLLVALVVWLVRRRANAPQPQAQRAAQYDGPSRGRLQVLQGPLAGETFPLIDDVTTIGSMAGNTLVIADASVSRRHAAIKIDQMRYEVADINSTNGVLVNDQKIHKVFLRDGDKIQIGTTVLQFWLK